MPRSTGYLTRAGCRVGNVVGIVRRFTANRSSPCHHACEIDVEDRVSALPDAILFNVFPFLLVGVSLFLGPGNARRIVERARIRRPGEGMHLQRSHRYRERLAAAY